MVYNMKTTRFILTGLLFSLITGCSNSDQPVPGDYYVPATLSPEAQKVLRAFPHKDTLETYPGENDIANWQKYWAYNEKKWQPLKRFGCKGF